MTSTDDNPPDSTSSARTYYDSPSADTFYYRIWGGEDIHIGLYDLPSSTIKHASQKTVEQMASMASPLSPSTRVLDLGAGYGGAARYLARIYGCKVTCLNLSTVQNERNRAMSAEQGLGDLIDVIDGAFESLPFGDATFDVVWSQDSFLHSDAREKVVAEIARVLVPSGGKVIFTDIMRTEEADDERLVPIRKRLSIESDLATRRFYTDVFSKLGFEHVGFVQGTEHMIMHYSKILATLEDRDVIADLGMADEFVENSKTGLRYWVDGGKDGQLEWGTFHFRR